MVWSFTWRRSWDEIWEASHLARWQAALARPDTHATPFAHPAVVRAWLGAMGGEARFAPHFLHARHVAPTGAPSGIPPAGAGQDVLWLLVRPRTGWQQGYVRRLVPAGGPVGAVGTGGMLFDYHEPVVVCVIAAGISERWIPVRHGPRANAPKPENADLTENALESMDKGHCY